MKKYSQCVFFVVLFLAFLGCDTGFSHTSDLPSTNNPPANSSPKTIEWDLGTDGFWQMYTNESRYCNYVFSMLINNNKSNQNVFESEIKKISGARNQTYGMIFGAADINNLYFIDITVDGYYEIGKMVNGSVGVTERTYSSKLRTGFNTINTIKVTKSGSTFQLSFNGSTVVEFTDSEIRGSRIGASATVGSSGEESFPNTPVEVKFRQTGQ